MKLPPAENRTLLRAPPSRSRDMSPAAHWGHRLPEGTRLDEFEITGVVGEGGFGIVYMAFDHSLQRRVALKEYMPSSLAIRVSGESTVQVKFEHQVETFHIGLRSFVNEARLLAQFDHPALVKVHRFWEANGTAYMAMPFYEGPTLRTALAKLGHPPDEQWLRQLLDPLLDVLSFLHAAQCFHRDVAPDNILLTPTGPLLLDFGAARRVIGAANQALTVILKPGYAPIEQYGQATAMGQGPWTDIYALACVVYCAITRKPPMASIERFMGGQLEPVSKLAAGKYNEHFLRAIDAGLAVKPEDRPKDIAQFRALLDPTESLPPDATEIARTRTRVELGAIKSKVRTLMREDTARSDPAPRAAKSKRSGSIGVWLGLVAIIAVTLTGAHLFNTWQVAPTTPEISKPSTTSPVAGAPLAQEATANDPPTESAPADPPARLALSPEPQAVEIAQQTDAPSVEDPPIEDIRPEASGIAASTNEPQQSKLTTSTGASAKKSHTDSSPDQTQRCEELTRKGSLESLSPEETDTLRNNC